MITDTQLETFLDALNAHIYEHDKRSFPNITPENPYRVVIAKKGRKYIKLIDTRSYGGNGRSVYCFLDFDGNIFKAASWNAPAKHIRGHISDDFWGTSLGPYGAAYLR